MKNVYCTVREPTLRQALWTQTDTGTVARAGYPSNNRYASVVGFLKARVQDTRRGAWRALGGGGGRGNSHPHPTPTPQVQAPWPTSLVSTACRHPSLISSIPILLHREVYSYSKTPNNPPKCNLKSQRYVGDTSRTSFPEGFLNLRRFQNCIFTTRRDENATCLSRGTSNGFLQQHSIKPTRCTLQTRFA